MTKVSASAGLVLATVRTACILSFSGLVVDTFLCTDRVKIAFSQSCGSSCKFTMFSNAHVYFTMPLCSGICSLKPGSRSIFNITGLEKKPEFQLALGTSSSSTSLVLGKS